MGRGCPDGRLGGCVAGNVSRLGPIGVETDLGLEFDLKDYSGWDSCKREEIWVCLTALCPPSAVYCWHWDGAMAEVEARGSLVPVRDIAGVGHSRWPENRLLYVFVSRRRYTHFGQE